VLISEAIKSAGHEGKVKIAMDCAASEFYGEPAAHWKPLPLTTQHQRAPLLLLSSARLPAGRPQRPPCLQALGCRAARSAWVARLQGRPLAPLLLSPSTPCGASRCPLLNFLSSRCCPTGEDGKYDLAFKAKDNDGSEKKSGEEMAAFYADLASKYPIVSIEVRPRCLFCLGGDVFAECVGGLGVMWEWEC
jgi:hypothetical protein